MRIDLTDLDQLEIFAESATVVEWNGRPALRVVNGLVLVKGLEVENARLRVDLGAPAGEGAFPGIAFRALSQDSHETVYVQPQTSGEPDAIQYDPICNGNNTWQLYNGLGYQAAATIPSGEWLTLSVDVTGERAAAWVEDGAPNLIIPQLVHGRRTGRIGVWTFRPAYFADLWVEEPVPVPEVAVEKPPSGTVTQWQLEGYGAVDVEPNGVLNLSRYLRHEGRPAVLSHDFEAEQTGAIELSFGFSDELRLLVDGQEVFAGSHLWRLPEHGWVEPGARRVRVTVEAGRHQLTAILTQTESFGWGLTVSIEQR